VSSPVAAFSIWAALTGAVALDEKRELPSPPMSPKADFVFLFVSEPPPLSVSKLLLDIFVLNPDADPDSFPNGSPKEAPARPKVFDRIDFEDVATTFSDVSTFPGIGSGTLEGGGNAPEDVLSPNSLFELDFWAMPGLEKRDDRDGEDAEASPLF
jgi:hypothetical protein